MDYQKTTQELAPVVISFITAGGIGSLVTYFMTKSKIASEVKKIDAETVTTLADGWQKYAQKLEERIDEMEQKYEDRIHDLEILMNEREVIYNQTIADKDNRIVELEGRVSALEAELIRYKEDVTQ